MKTIKITEPTHTKLKLLGKKGETFDQIILKLIKKSSAYQK